MQGQTKINSVEQAFTMIEMLVVISILGILAAVALISVQGIAGRGDNSACKSEVEIVNTATQAYYAKSTLSVPVYPKGPTVSDLEGQLKADHLLSSNSQFPGATKEHSPAYDPTTGAFTADC